MGETVSIGRVMAQTLQQLMNTLPQTGAIEWIGLRPGRDEPMLSVGSVNATNTDGLEGDRYSKGDGKRQVTLIQAEHLQAVASMLGKQHVEPATVRRNIVVRGINLLALKGKSFRAGNAVLEYTGLCHPCSKMERVLGAGGYNAMRGHGGITARVLTDGNMAIGDSVTLADAERAGTSA